MESSSKTESSTCSPEGTAPPASCSLSLRRELRVALGYLVFALVFQVVLGWPSRPVGGALEGDYGTNLWNLWWVSFSLCDLGQNPLWTQYVFAPEGIRLHGHSLSLANGLIALPFTRLWGPVAAYDFLFLFHTWLTAWGFHKWASKRTPDCGAVLTAVFAAAGPFRLSHLNHLNLFSTGFLGWALWAWDRVLEKKKPKDVFLFFIAWLLTSFAAWYHGIAIGIYVLCSLIIRTIHERHFDPRRYAAFVVAVLFMALMVSAYRYPSGPETLGEPDPEGTPLIVAHHWSNSIRDVWTPDWFSARPLGSEWSFHPGLLVLALVLAGACALKSSSDSKSQNNERIPYSHSAFVEDTGVALVCFLLSLGPVAFIGESAVLLPAFLFSILPGFDTVRVFARFMWYGWVLLLPLAWLGAENIVHRISLLSSFKSSSVLIEPISKRRLVDGQGEGESRLGRDEPPFTHVPQEPGKVFTLRKGILKLVLVVLLVVMAFETQWLQRIHSAIIAPDPRPEMLVESALLSDDSQSGNLGVVIELPIRPSSRIGAQLARQTVHHHPLVIGEFSRYQLIHDRTLTRYTFLNPDVWQQPEKAESLAQELKQAGVDTIRIDTRTGMPWSDDVVRKVGAHLQSNGLRIIWVGGA